MSNSSTGANNTFNLILKTLFEIYVEPRPEPLSFIMRLIYSFLGSATFLFFTDSIDLIVPKTNLGSSQPESLNFYFQLRNIEMFELLPFFDNIILFILALMFAIVNANGYSKHGSIRYFIGGLLLPAFALVVARSVAV